MNELAFQLRGVSCKKKVCPEVELPWLAPDCSGDGKEQQEAQQMHDLLSTLLAAVAEAAVAAAGAAAAAAVQAASSFWLLGLGFHIASSC